MNKRLQYIINIIQIVIVIHVIFVTSLMFFQNNYGFSQIGNTIIYSARDIDHDNISSINKGDLIIIKNNSKMKKDDTLYYYSVDRERYIIVSGKYIKKDNNNSLYIKNNDTTIIIPKSRVAGNKICKIHFLGSVLNLVESKIGFIFFVLLPIVLVFVYQIYQFIVLLNGKDK